MLQGLFGMAAQTGLLRTAPDWHLTDRPRALGDGLKIVVERRLEYGQLMSRFCQRSRKSVFEQRPILVAHQFGHLNGIQGVGR